MAAPGAGLAQQDHHSLTFQHSCSVPLVLAPLKNLFIREKTPPHSQQGQGRAVCQQPGHIQLLSVGLGEAGEQAEGFPCKSRMKRVCRRQSCVLLCWQLPSVLSGESRHQPGAESIPCCLHSLLPAFPASTGICLRFLSLRFPSLFGWTPLCFLPGGSRTCPDKSWVWVVLTSCMEGLADRCSPVRVGTGMSRSFPKAVPAQGISRCLLTLSQVSQ